MVETLQAWSRQGRRIQFLANDLGPLRAGQPRLLPWRITWSHIVEAHACRPTAGGSVPSAVWSPHWMMERIDIDHGVMLASHAPERRRALRERLQVSWQTGVPSFPATTLGL